MTNTHKNKGVQKTRVIATIQQIIGWIITIFFGMITLIGGGSQFKEVLDVVMCVIFHHLYSAVTLLIIKGCRRKNLLKHFMIIIADYHLIHKNPLTSLLFRRVQL